MHALELFSRAFDLSLANAWETQLGTRDERVSGRRNVAALFLFVFVFSFFVFFSFVAIVVTADTQCFGSVKRNLSQHRSETPELVAFDSWSPG